jgi:hypothetical protein
VIDRSTCDRAHLSLFHNVCTLANACNAPACERTSLIESNVVRRSNAPQLHSNALAAPAKLLLVYDRS